MTGGKKKAEVGSQESEVRSQKAEVGKKLSISSFQWSVFSLIGSKPGCPERLLPTAYCLQHSKNG